LISPAALAVDAATARTKEIETSSRNADEFFILASGLCGEKVN
jgi:hypothetical protein